MTALCDLSLPSRLRAIIPSSDDICIAYERGSVHEQLHVLVKTARQEV